MVTRRQAHYVISGVNTTINGGSGAVNVNQLALLAGEVFNGGISMNLGGGNDETVVTGNSAVTAANSGRQSEY